MRQRGAEHHLRDHFLGFSYGFRPGRSQHNAALYVGLLGRSNWVLDVDIRGFFDAIDHGWLVKFVEHRIGDRRVVRLIQKWLNAGVLEDGTRTRSEQGTGNPLLANLPHYVDLWVRRWRQTQAWRIVVRYADDRIPDRSGRAVWAELTERVSKFALELHPDTRLMSLGFAAENRRRRGQGKPRP